MGSVLRRADYGVARGLPLKMRDVADAPSWVPELRTTSRLVRRDVSNNTIIALSVIIPILAALGVLVYLHRRVVRKEKQEDSMDPHKSLDFGLGDHTNKGGKGGKRKSIMGLGKDHAKYRQMSMDMSLSSPYLLPPELQTSRESLARSLQLNEDPYRPVVHYAASDAASMRSMPKGRAVSSIYTVSSHDREAAARSDSRARSGVYMNTSRRNSLLKSPLSPLEPVHMKPASTSPEHMAGPPLVPEKDPFRSAGEFSSSDSTSIPYPVEEQDSASMPPVPVIREPPSARQIARKPAPGTTVAPDLVDHDRSLDNFDPHLIGQAQTSEDVHSHGPASRDASDFMLQPEDQAVSGGSLPQISSLPPITTTLIETPEEGIGGGWFAEQDQHDHEERGRSVQRESVNYQAAAQTGLGIPEQNMRRLSVGLRPLPPDDLMDSEDPETRANRIRSFYREYFDESKPDPMPALERQNGGAEYYEAYDHNYPGGAPYYDPGSNAFVMPYAQPVARRAMTPPPSGSRFPGPRAPRPRHGPSASGHYTPRPGSSVSNAYGRPRAGSTMSGGRWRAPKKPLPPPTDLTTLPNPSKLKDDNIAIFNSLDFAPPETFKERAAGRPQSPAGERRPYQLNVPAHSPLVNAFDELAALPSPHLLRKSGTFTALDFAPPRKFTELDSQSETGSIRSNRSGISRAQLNAIRGGAGRVSRLPGDTIFTTAQTQQKLKPSWNMRD